MSERLRLRRHLYELHGQARPASRRRRSLRRQLAVVGNLPDGPDDDGSAGVREPRRPAPSAGPSGRAQPSD